MIHVTRRWPFLERAATREAREQHEATVKQRPKVDRLVAELVQRGQQNHFAEQLRAAFGGGKNE